MNRFGRALCLLTALMTLACVPALADDDRDALFDAAAAALRSPAQEGVISGAYSLRLGDTAYVPAVAPEIAPFDEPEAASPIPIDGTFDSSDESVVSVSMGGVMTAVGEGAATVTYHAAAGDIVCSVTVARDTPAEKAKAMAYIAKREYYTVKRARLPKYNKYAKWYYGKKKEVGWCSVFTIWCANASGNEPIKEKAAPETLDQAAVLYFREGQVGNQYDGFMRLGRFGGIPRVGYPVIYADLSKGYRTTHIGVVVEAEERGDGSYQVTTVEGNMSNSVKSYCYLYDSKLDNSTVGVEKGLKLRANMSELPAGEQTDPLLQYELHTDHWAVFGFGMSWLPIE